MRGSRAAADANDDVTAWIGSLPSPDNCLIGGGAKSGSTDYRLTVTLK